MGGRLGDSACETAIALIACKWLGYEDFVDGRPLDQAYEEIISQLILMPYGLWRRHPARDTPRGWTDYWASLWWYGTRDNGTGLLIATIVFNDLDRTKAMLDLCKTRFWLSPAVLPRNVYAWEEDHIKFSPKYKKFDPRPRMGSPLLMWKSFFNRSINKFRLTLWFWDLLSSLFPVLHLRKMVKYRSSGNHLNAIVRCWFCRLYDPTLVSRLAYKLLPRDQALELEFPEGGKNPPMKLLFDELRKFKIKT